MHGDLVHQTLLSYKRLKRKRSLIILKTNIKNKKNFKQVTTVVVGSFGTSQ